MDELTRTTTEIQAGQARVLSVVGRLCLMVIGIISPWQLVTQALLKTA